MRLLDRTPSFGSAVVAIFMTFAAATAGAATINATGVARAAVQEAINLAAEGDVVIVPPGEITWSTPLTIDKGIELRGAGIGQTVITNPNTDWHTATIEVEATIGSPFEISGFTFVGSGGDADHIIIDGSSRAFRIHHNKFTNGGAHSIWIQGDVYGVIDHNQFIDPSREVISTFDKGTGDESWSRPPLLGTDEALYVEDNTFEFNTIGDHAITTINGGRYVFRYNTVTSAASLNASQIDVHGNFFVDRGGRSFEIYENELHSEDSYQGMYIRGGVGVIFNNTMTGSYYRPIILTNYRSFDTPSSETAGACGYSACSHPAPDQIQDTYLWNNTYQGSEIQPYVDSRGLVRDHIQQGRDFFMTERPNYTPYTYPHPLVTEEQDGGPPLPPTGLRQVE